MWKRLLRMIRGWFGPPVERTARAKTIEAMTVKSDATLARVRRLPLESYRRSKVGR
jgi:hypothetical protein